MPASFLWLRKMVELLRSSIVLWNESIYIRTASDGTNIGANEWNSYEVRFVFEFANL